jgi:hypothetical protein
MSELIAFCFFGTENTNKLKHEQAKRQKAAARKEVKTCPASTFPKRFTHTGTLNKSTTGIKEAVKITKPSDKNFVKCDSGIDWS